MFCSEPHVCPESHIRPEPNAHPADVRLKNLGEHKALGALGANTRFAPTGIDYRDAVDMVRNDNMFQQFKLWLSLGSGDT